MPAQAETIITNGRVLTMDPGGPEAEAVALADGRVLAVGRNADISALAGPDCTRIDAGGGTVLPGFIESHMHLFPGGAELAHLQLLDVDGHAALAAAVQRYAAERPDAPILLAQGAGYGILPGGVTRHDLDAIIPDRPFAMFAADHHTAWANTAALNAAGLLKGNELSPGNEVVMGDDGYAAGELREFEAFTPILELAGEGRVTLGLSTGGEPDPAPSEAERAHDRDILVRGLAHCARHGLTSLVTMDGNRYTLELLSELRTAGDLSARVRVPFHFRNFRDLGALEQASAMTRDFADDWLTSGFVKLFMDGVLDSGTAVTVNDYPGRPGWRGEPLFDSVRFAAIATEADRRGLQIAVHAIGDGAVQRVLDGYEAAREANGHRDARHRIEHIELIHPDDVPRLGGLGVVASLQPGHVPGAMDFPIEPTMTKIGWDRARDAYPYARLRDAGAALAFASDWPVADISPLRGIQAVMTRQPFDATCADERVSLREALAAYTIGGAWAEHTDDRKGMLRPGYLADLVILSGDIEAVPADRIETLQVLYTLCNGEAVYRAAEH
jgi:predicted amidohydrolase YtcJ